MVSCLYIVHCSSLFQPVACEGQIETWLSSFVSSLKGSLQFQMATALGYEKPRPKRRTIRSAGSRKVSMPVRASSSLSKQNKGWWSRELCRVVFIYLLRMVIIVDFWLNVLVKLREKLLLQVLKSLMWFFWKLWITCRWIVNCDIKNLHKIRNLRYWKV